nr:MAG TPA: hypothetical protein [Caudoviricetes sp.]
MLLIIKQLVVYECKGMQICLDYQTKLHISLVGYVYLSMI